MGKTRSRGGLLSKSCHLSPFPPTSRKGSQCLLPARWSKTAPGEPFPAFLIPGSPPRPLCSMGWRGPRCQCPQVPREPGSWPRCAQAAVTRSGPFPAPSIDSGPPSVWAGVCGMGRGQEQAVWLRASPESVEIRHAGKSWKGVGEVVPRSCSLLGRACFSPKSLASK